MWKNLTIFWRMNSWPFSTKCHSKLWIMFFSLKCPNVRRDFVCFSFSKMIFFVFAQVQRLAATRLVSYRSRRAWRHPARRSRLRHSVDQSTWCVGGREETPEWSTRRRSQRCCWRLRDSSKRSVSPRETSTTTSIRPTPSAGCTSTSSRWRFTAIR